MVCPQPHRTMLTIAEVAPCTSKLWRPARFGCPANPFLRYMAVDGRLQYGCETGHLVLNLGGRRKSLKYPLLGGKEALALTLLRDCGREGLPIDLIPGFTMEHL